MNEDANGIPKHNHAYNAGAAEQAGYGITTGTPDWARDGMIGSGRISRGLDPYTGQPVVYGPRQPSWLSVLLSELFTRGDRTEKSEFGAVLFWVFKLLFAVGMLVAAGGALLYARARSDDAAIQQDPVHGGLSRGIAAKLFPGEEMSPASTYLTKSELAASHDEHEVLRAINIIHDLKPVVRWDNLSNPELRHVMAVSYACQVDPACRVRAQSVLNGPDDPRMMNYAARFLERNTRKGMESAAKDLCDLLLLTANTRATALHAPEYCSLALRANPSSLIARDHVSRLDDPSIFRWLAVVSWVDPK